MPAKPTNFAGHALMEFIKMFKLKFTSNTTNGITHIYMSCMVYNLSAQRSSFSLPQEMA
jgi:hypothetical protein